MAEIAKIPAVLVLIDGTVFHGKSAGKIGTTTGSTLKTEFDPLIPRPLPLHPRFPRISDRTRFYTS